MERKTEMPSAKLRKAETATVWQYNRDSVLK